MKNRLSPELWLRSVGQLTKLLDFQMLKSSIHLYRLLNLKLVTIILTMKQRSSTRDLKLVFLYFPRYKNLTFQKSSELKNGRITKNSFFVVSKNSRPKFEMDFAVWDEGPGKVIVMVRQSSAYLLLGRVRTRNTSIYLVFASKVLRFRRSQNNSNLLFNFYLFIQSPFVWFSSLF